MLIILLTPLGVNAAPVSYSLEIDGLACPFCAYGVEKKLSSIDGVEEIRVDIEKGRVIVIMSDGSTLSESSAREQVNKAGFTLRSITRLNEGE
jgi:mercuric ion binding protein